MAEYYVFECMVKVLQGNLYFVINAKIYLRVKRLLHSVPYTRIYSVRVARSLVLDIKDTLPAVEAAVVVAEGDLVERLGLVEPVTVGCAELIGVSVLLGAPAGAIPVLSVHSVTTGH